MTDTPSTTEFSAEDPLELLLAEALGILESDGRKGLEAFLAAHPAEADQIREAIEELRGASLLADEDQSLPERLGDFAIKERIGAGGMGVVFLAEQTTLGRNVAVKLIRPELLLFEGARERFRREIDAVARLDHPAVVPILATGAPDEVPYYAMPLLRGRNAQQIISELSVIAPRHVTAANLLTALASDAGETPDDDAVFAGTYWQAVVRLVRKAALGIHHAHQRGVLHRDLKPSNIMLTASGQAIVLDFGLALSGEDARITRSGATAGSPAYMSPEQVRGENTDERTDVYGLAATLHSLLGLATPFEIASTEQLRHDVLAGNYRDLRSSIDVPTELHVVLACAMDIDRWRRYASALAFADDLLAVLENRPIAARRLPTAVRMRRFGQRHPALAAAAGVLLLFAFVVPLLLLWQQSEANAQLQEQVRRSDRSVRISIQAVRRLLAGSLTNELRNRVAAQEVAVTLLQDALDLFEELELEDKFSDEVLDLRLQTNETLIGVLTAMSRFEEVDEACAHSATMLAGAEPTASRKFHIASLQRVQASTRMEKLDHEGVPELLRAATATFEEMAESEDHREAALKQLAAIADMEAGLAMRSGNMADAEAHLRRAMDMTRQLSSKDAPTSSFATSWLNLVRLLKALKRYDEAMVEVDGLLDHLVNAAAKFDRGWPTVRYVRAMGLNERFRLLQLSDRTDEALAACDVAIEMLGELARDYPDAPEVPRLRGTALGNQAIIWMNRESFDRAIELGRRAVADQREALRQAPNDRQAIAFLANHQRVLVVCLRRAGRWSELAEEALTLCNLRIRPMWREGAARDLLRSARTAEPKRAAFLREQAMQNLLRASADGRKIAVDDELYDPLRSDERFGQLDGR